MVTCTAVRIGKLEGKNISRMPKHVPMDQTLRGHSAIAERFIILVSKTENFGGLAHLGTKHIDNLF